MSEPSVLESIRGPADLKSLDAAGRARLAGELRQRICEATSRHGGHFGSNMGVVELTIALHTVFESPHDKIVWDTSHQCYSHKMLTGRTAELLEGLRTYGGPSGFCHKGESEHDTAFAGHAGTALSIALGISRGFEAAGSPRCAVGVVGDASLASGMTLEALNHAGWLKTRALFVFNDNGMAIEYPVGGLHEAFQALRPWVTHPERHAAGEEPGALLERKRAGLEEARARVARIFEQFGLRYVGPIDGHDVEALIEALRAVKDLPGPTLLHIHTRKGAGWDPALDDPVAWHAAQGFLLPSPATKKLTKARSWTQAFTDIMLELAAEDERVVAVTAAMLGGTGLQKFADRYPQRTFDVGICEQHGAGFASGMTLTGLKPVLAVYSTFLQRCYDQILHDVAIQGNPLVIAMDRGGLVGADGVTHQGLFDISYLRCIPDLVLCAPKDEPEMRAMLRWAVNSGRIVGIRWPRANVPAPLAETTEPIELGQGEVVAVGDGSAAILAYGAMVELALQARALLQEDGISLTVANARFAKPIDLFLLEALLESHEVVVTAEDHTATGGFGSACLEEAAKLVPEHVGKLRLAGVADAFVHHGARELQLRDAGLDAAGLAARVKAALAARPLRRAIAVPELSVVA
jgi:1-deoxy-D-xylulose-5-phosphate synthase